LKKPFKSDPEASGGEGAGCDDPRERKRKKERKKERVFENGLKKK
jgi:hypothetical protein